MGKIKQKYSTPLLQLYDINKRFICNLTNRNLKNSAYSIKKKLTTNDVKTLTFSIPFDNEYIHNNSCEYLIKFEFDWYIIKNITLSSEEVSILEVSCEEEFSISKTVLCTPLELIGCSPKEMFDGIMSSIGNTVLDYKFKGTDIASYRSIIVEDESSVFENLIKMAEVFEAILEMSTDSYGQKWIFLRKNPYDRSKVVRKGYDATSININYNTEEIFTRLMPFGDEDEYGIEVNIGDVNPTGKLYIENYNYYKEKGLTDEEIANNPQCQAMTVRRYENVLDPAELLSIATEELNNISKPVVTGNLELCDLSVLEDSSMIEPLIYEKIIVVDETTKMRFDSLIQEIEYDYDDILNSKISLNNTISYKSIFKDLATAGEKIDKVTTTNPTTGKTSVIASVIQGKIDSAVTQIGTMLDTIESPQADYAILFEDRRVGSSLYGALAIGTRGILISHELKEDNTWNWTTAINSLGVNASEVVTGTLWADIIKAGILSDINNTSWINMEDGTFSLANGGITFDGDKFNITIGGKTIDEIVQDTGFTVVPNREGCVIILDEDGTPSKNYEFDFTFVVNKNNTTETIPCVIKDVVSSSNNISTRWDNTSNKVTIIANTDTVFTDNNGILDITLETTYGDVKKTIYWNTVINTVEVSDVRIIPSGTVFSMSSESSAYTPEFITFTPAMTLCDFISWTYSKDGVNWIEVTNQNGLSIKDNTLTVLSTSSLFTDIENSITFKVNCTNNASDMETVLRIRDGVIGKDAVVVQIDNENHTFIGNQDGQAISSELEINILGYSGVTKKPTLVNTITGIPNGMKVEIIGNNTINNKIKITTNSTMTSLSGTLKIPIECMGETFNKIFSYTLAIPGLDGEGARVTTIRPTSTIFKYDATNEVYIPNKINLIPEFLNENFLKWQYSTDGGYTWKDVNKNTNGVIIDENTNVLTINGDSDIFDINSSLDVCTWKLLGQMGYEDVLTITRVRDGERGEQGVAGIDGEDGITYYTWIRYADDKNGNGISNDPTNKKYIGLAYNKTTPTESNNPKDYKWSAITGKDGVDGADGEDGISYYTWIAYSDYEDGSEMYQEPNENTKYIGIAINKETPIESNDPNDYTWSRFKGDNGNDGEPSVNVILDNENHSFVANYEGYAIATTITVNIFGYVGATLSKCSVGSISGKPTGMTVNIKNNNTTNVSLEIKVSTSMTQRNGVLTIPITCNGIVINKKFTYGLILDGTPASTVKIVGSANCFLSNNGGKTYEPESLTFYGLFTECSFGKWQYLDISTNAYKDVISGALGLTLSGEKLIISNTSHLFSTNSGSITFKLMSSEGHFDIITVNKFTQVENIGEELDNIKSSITQTNNNWKAEFTLSNTSNILYDGDFNLEVNDWHWYPINEKSNITSQTINAYPFYDTHQGLKTTIKGTETGCGYEYDLELLPNTDYVYQAYIYTDNVAINTDENMPLSFWTWTGDTPTSSETTNTSEIIDYNQIIEKGRFDLCYVHFKTKDLASCIKCRLFIKGNTNATNATSNLVVREVCFRQRTMVGKYEPNPNEVKAGVTTIDINGLTVEHSEAKTKTQMSADGFFIVDSNGEVIAELASKEQWSQLKADKVFAGNIENMYEGNSNLYVNHSYTGYSDGSESKPFKSFADLQFYLGLTPIINKDLFIYVANPGFEITEQLRLHSLKGSGIIQITFDKNCVLRNIGKGQFCIRLYQIAKRVWILGGRSSVTASDGALLVDNPSDSEGGHGIYASDVSTLEINYLSINCKNWGIMIENTDLYTYAVDFGKCYCAIEAQRQSIYYSSADCGSGTSFCRLKSGAKGFWGNSSECQRPCGIVEPSNGIFYSFGNCAEVNSYRFGSGQSKPSVPATNQYTQSFGWTSHKTYAYNYNNWSDNDCKQGSWGYGLRGGHMFFDINSIRSFLSGTVLDGNTITLTRANSGGISGGAKVFINGSSCSSASGTPIYGNQTYLGTLAWGETKTFNLPKEIVQGLKNGSYNSLAVYVNSTANDCYLNIVNASITLKVNK